VCFDERIEIDGIEISPIRIRQSGNVPPRDRVADPPRERVALRPRCRMYAREAIEAVAGG
jgi:hypothetical protein